ncbi:NAD(P)-dependent oxidoreductase [Arthrobacter sp. NPDC058130]|uniref:NAD(P)-dependent oxidoreductase n=1 Tax=Arthrobacter sp. NPDC058130 TaxID=3346353 RepID=UPI0036E74C2D
MELARPVFGSIAGYDTFIPDGDPGLAELGVERCSLEEMVLSSDLISLHLPLTPDTTQLFDATMLASMKAGSFIINVSRGGLIDSQALKEALDAGHIASAGLDVLDHEPPAPDHPLLEHPGVMLTPHIAFLSAQTNGRTKEGCRGLPADGGADRRRRAQGLRGAWRRAGVMCFSLARSHVHRPPPPSRAYRPGRAAKDVRKRTPAEVR